MITESKPKVLLAIDPFEKDLHPNAEALNELKYWLKNIASDVEAVYVLTIKADDPGVEIAERKAIEKLEYMIQQMKLSSIVTLKVLMNFTTSRKDVVRTLVSYAKLEKFGLILVSSHGRQGMSRLVMGSFAETLLHDSSVPVLFLGNRPSQEFLMDQVLYATDYSEGSYKGYQALLKQMKELNPVIILYHVIPQLSMFYDYSLTGLGAYLPESFWKTQKEMVIQRAEIWAELARNKGYQVRVRIDDVSAKDIALFINRVADEEKTALIAIASPRLGSTSKEIFRNRKHGVWVFGPSAIENVLEEPSQVERYIEKKTLNTALHR